MHTFRSVFTVLVFFLVALRAASAIAIDNNKILPSQSCADGWIMDGKVQLFDKESLFDRINGESELYFPYGFEILAYARYENKKDPKIGIDADVYTMGSLIDAFGMFANYRKKDDADLAIGAQGTVSDSQVFFYQDRYFVRLQVTGANSAPRDAFLACARAIAQKLPGSAVRPKVLDILVLPEVVKKSERYIAQSVLGYEFFRKGLVADAVLNSAQVQVFMVIESAADAAKSSMEKYRAYLAVNGKNVKITETKEGPVLEATDPLYGGIVAAPAGRFVIGVIRASDTASALQFLGRIRSRTVLK